MVLNDLNINLKCEQKNAFFNISNIYFNISTVFNKHFFKLQFKKEKSIN